MDKIDIQLKDMTLMKKDVIHDSSDDATGDTAITLSANSGGTSSYKDRKAYIQARNSKIKDEREELIRQWSHLPISKKIRVTVSNGYSLIGLTDTELTWFCEMMEEKSLKKKKK
jgi:hypothetical protein